jgi:hypothetical protein
MMCVTVCDVAAPGSSGSYRRLAECNSSGHGTGTSGNGVGEYTSSSAASERSHTYESIPEGHYYPDSFKNGLLVNASLNGEGGGGVTTTLASNIGGLGLLGGGGGGGGGGMNMSMNYSTPPPVSTGLYPDPRATPYSEPEFCDCGCASSFGLLHHFPGYTLTQAALDGYYSDRCTQTLPLRHFRPVVTSATPTSVTGGGGTAGAVGVVGVLGNVNVTEQRDQPSPFAPAFNFDGEENSNNGGGEETGVSGANESQQSVSARPPSRQSNGSRRRTSSGSHYSDRSFGGSTVTRRNIPALHANYFDPPEPAEPDTFQS